MSAQKKSSKRTTAAELMARLQNDPEYQRKMQEQEAELQARVRELTRAEQPIVADLRSVGLEVESVWDLVNTSVPYPEALPVLLKHLQIGGYPDRVMDSLARALAVKPAVFAWDQLRELYLKATGRGEQEGLAVALTASATKDHLEALIDLLNDQSRRETRGHFLTAIKRVGGSRGLELLESLKDDPLFGQEARRLLKTRSKK